MRELYEYTAEVRQRIGQKQETRRRNRRRFVTCAASLLLVLVVGSAALLPGMLRRAAEQTPDAWTENNTLDGDERTEDTPESVEEEFPIALHAVELWRLASDGQWVLSDTQPEDPDGVAAWMLQIDPYAFGGTDGIDQQDEAVTETVSEQTPVRIVLTDASGVQAEYVFNGTELIKLPENHQIPLTDKQITELNALLFGDS